MEKGQRGEVRSKRTAKWVRSKKGHIRTFGLVAGVYLVFSLLALALIGSLSAGSGAAAASGLPVSPAKVGFMADQAFLAAIPLCMIMMGTLLWVLMDIRGLLFRQVNEKQGRGKESKVVRMRERNGGTRSYRRAS